MRRRGRVHARDIRERAATRKVHAAVKKAGYGASYHFDYETQEAVITVPGKKVTLDKWVWPAAEKIA